MAWLKNALVGLCLFAAAAVANAQSYPNRPIRIIVGYPAGGSPDVNARIFGQPMAEILGQPIIVENRSGAGGVIATSYVKSAPADGYTLLLGELGQLLVAELINKTLPYDFRKDFKPVASITEEPLVLVTNAQSVIVSFSDFVAQAKARPNALTYASAGVGTIHHLSLETLKADAGIEVLHIPYKGSAETVPAVLAGNVSVAMVSFTTAGSLIRSGALRALAVTSPRRISHFPNTPAISEFITGFNFSSEMGMLLPIGAENSVVEKLAAAIKQASESAELLSKFKNTATIVTYRTPAEYAQFLRDSYRKYERAVALSKLERK